MAVMTAEACWTLDELVRRVAVALAGPAYPGSPNGRVRDLPDRRAVRWYATIGLVDRPAAMRGRTALYGPRHLLQLVAVKRRQAEGRSLADIQAELAGATDAKLRRIAGIPEALLAAGSVAAEATGDAVHAAAEVPGDPRSATAEAGPAVPGEPRYGGRRARFWAEPPPADPAGRSDPVGEPAPADDTVTTLSAVRLPCGVVVLLPAHPDDDDLAAIRAAARPLLDVLADRGLLPREGWSPV